MSDTTSTPAPGPEPSKGNADTNGGCRGGRGRRRGRVMLAGVAIATGLVGFGIGKATSGHWGRGFGPFGHGMHRTMDADTLIRRADGGVDKVLNKVSATAEQKTKVADIVKTAIKDLAPLRDTHKAVRDKLVAALKAEKVDRATIEQLRTEEIGLAETLTKRAAQAMADIADVLTPSQRAQLIDRWQSRFSRG